MLRLREQIKNNTPFICSNVGSVFSKCLGTWANKGYFRRLMPSQGKNGLVRSRLGEAIRKSTNYREVHKYPAKLFCCFRKNASFDNQDERTSVLKATINVLFYDLEDYVKY